MIPKRFQIAGIPIKVKLDPNLFKERQLLGEVRYPLQEIVLDCTMLSTEMMEQNYFHELCHEVLYIMNENELRDNEKFVDLFASLLHQALKTGEDFYSEKELKEFYTGRIR